MAFAWKAASLTYVLIVPKKSFQPLINNLVTTATSRWLPVLCAGLSRRKRDCKPKNEEKWISSLRSGRYVGTWIAPEEAHADCVGMQNGKQGENKSLASENAAAMAQDAQGQQ